MVIAVKLDSREFSERCHKGEGFTASSSTKMLVIAAVLAFEPCVMLI